VAATASRDAEPAAEQLQARLPLRDVKILDLMWVLAGPGITRMLADYGATVVRVESVSRTDPVRTVGPFKDGKSGRELSPVGK
jgi:benzylsuccinate CoA-transferase BbsF subunit